MESMYLVGAEDVKNAAYTMRNAADTISQAVGNLDDILRRHTLAMEDMLQRYTECLKSS